MPFYGFDVAHRHCEWPKRAGAGPVYMESLCLQSAIWHPAATGLDPRGSLLSKAALVTRNDVAWDTWHDLRVLFEVALEEGKANFGSDPRTYGVGYQPAVEIVTPLYRRLLRALDDAVNAFDAGGLPGCAAPWRRPTARSAARPSASAPCSPATRTSTWSGSGRRRPASTRPATPSRP
ncbi:MAG: hypothetical protein WDO13_12955 [Verrucomicrobiota bacterium]